MAKILARSTAATKACRSLPPRTNWSCFIIMTYDFRIPPKKVQFPSDEFLTNLAKQYIPRADLELVERSSATLLVRVNSTFKQADFRPWIDHLDPHVSYDEAA